MRPSVRGKKTRQLAGIFIVMIALIILGLDMSGCSKKSKTGTTATGNGGKARALHHLPPHATLKQDPATEHFNKGLKYSLQGKYDQAIEEFNIVLKTRPESAAAYNDLGFAWYDKNDLDKAIEYHKKALELNPDLANVYFGLGLAYEKKGEREKALKNWQEFTKRTDPKNKWHLKAMDHIRRLTKKGKKKTH